MRTKMTQLKSMMRGQQLANQIHLRKEEIPCQSKRQWNFSFEANFSCSTLMNQKLYPYLGSETSSVWDFFSHCSNVILRGNQWRHEMFTVFSG